MMFRWVRIIEGYGNRDVRFVPVKSASGVGCAGTNYFELEYNGNFAQE